MPAALVLRRSRPGASSLVLCLCLPPLAGCAATAAGNAGEVSTQAPGGRAADVAWGAAAVSPELVPAPAEFEATGTALWDGRPTFEGVWVAHPLASAARRVRIYSEATGAAGDGALFARDPALTGPSILSRRMPPGCSASRPARRPRCGSLP
jgi:hypothetical protein